MQVMRFMSSKGTGSACHDPLQLGALTFILCEGVVQCGCEMRSSSDIENLRNSSAVRRWCWLTRSGSFQQDSAASPAWGRSWWWVGVFRLATCRGKSPISVEHPHRRGLAIRARHCLLDISGEEVTFDPEKVVGTYVMA